MKKTLNGFVQVRKDPYGLGDHDWRIEDFDLSICRHEDMSVCGMTMMAPAVITFDIPDNWDPRQAMVEVLRKEQSKVRAEFQKRLNELEDEISKYLAIGN
jgi:hypothetical protein